MSLIKKKKDSTYYYKNMFYTVYWLFERQLYWGSFGVSCDVMSWFLLAGGQKEIVTFQE